MPTISEENYEMMIGFCQGLSKELNMDINKLLTLFFQANLLPDVLRPTACSAFGVNKQMSETGKVMVNRTLDWPDADAFGILAYYLTADRMGLVSPLQSVTRMIYSDRDVYSFGMLGILCAVTLIDATNHTMVAILDASTKDAYSSVGKNSYVFDLLDAHRQSANIDKITAKMTVKPYAFNHLLLMADEEKVGILENNIKADGRGNGVRQLRLWDSKVMDGIAQWAYPHMIGAVNCFMLAGQPNNINTVSDLCNVVRWKQLQDKVKSIVDAKGVGGKLAVADMQTIQTTNSGNLDPKKFDNIYNYNTLQIVSYIPAQNKAYVYFKPFTGKPAVEPKFVELDLNMNKQ